MIFPLPAPYFSIIACSGDLLAFLSASSSGDGPASTFFVFWRKESFFGEGVLVALEEEALASLMVSVVLVVE